MQAYHATIIHTPTPTTLEIHPNTLLLIESGKITSIHPNTPPSSIQTLLSTLNHPSITPTIIPPPSFLCPGFIDTHTHAPQWSQRGLGRGFTLMTWLETITFPMEARCKDLEYASKLYSSCVSGGLRNGITTAAYYGSIHRSACRVLAEICVARGQRALVGKCNMDRNSPDWYRDQSVGESVRETEGLIEDIGGLGSELVTPVITPRFAISCTDGLLGELGELARRNPGLPIQTHFNESRGEMEFTRELFPTAKDETELYEGFGLLGERSILAHGIYLSEREVGRIGELGCGIAHCPISNTTMDAFMVAPVREYLRRGIKVGLGTDCGGGYTGSMLEVMRSAFVVSVARGESHPGDESLSVAEGFYLATRGGARVLGLETGCFEAGMEFDALLVTPGGNMTDLEDVADINEAFEKFVMTGDDRNIEGVWVAGRRVK